MLLKETIELDSDEKNELIFNVVVEGTSGPAKVRLVCENQDGIGFVFVGSQIEKDTIRFVIPELNQKEQTYPARIEVLVENKYFTPIEFDLKFKKKVSVVAERVNKVVQQVKPAVEVTAKFVTLADKFKKK